MRVIDKIWKTQSDNNLTGIDDIDLMVISVKTAKTLISEYEQEFGQKDVKMADISDLLGLRILITEDEGKEEFKLFKEIRGHS